MNGITTNNLPVRELGNHRKTLKKLVSLNSYEYTQTDNRLLSAYCKTSHTAFSFFH